MKYYAAVVNEHQTESATVLPPFSILTSYHYFKTKADFIKECVDKHFDVFVDSGAFSADNSGTEIDIDDYCKWIQRSGASIYAGLDVIGNAEATRKNIEYMEKEYGLRPIPTFHMGSTLEDLERVASGQYSYIALGGLVFSPGVIAHCDRVWDWILKNNPRLRVHGFGVTNVELMERYPWYSVDSSSFKACERFGRQSILFNGMEWKTFDEEDYCKILTSMGYDVPQRRKAPAIGKATGEERAKLLALKEEISNDNRRLWHIYRIHCVQSYKMYAAHLASVNKHRNFDFLTAQQSLF